MRLTFLPDRPFSLGLWVTDECNMACGYCYERKYKKPVDEWAGDGEILKFIKAIRPDALYFFGGEPLLALDRIEFFAKALKGDGIALCLSTNGSLLDEDVVGTLNDLGISIQYSLDSEGRGLDKLDVLARARRALPCLAISPDYRHLPKIVEAILGHGFRAILDFPLRGARYGDLGDFPRIYLEALAVARRRGACLLGSCGRGPRCSAFRRTLSIYLDGRVYGCNTLCLVDEPIGNIWDGIVASPPPPSSDPLSCRFSEVAGEDDEGARKIIAMQRWLGT